MRPDTVNPELISVPDTDARKLLPTLRVPEMSVLPDASTENLLPEGFPEDKSRSLYPAVKDDPTAEMRLPEMIFGPVILNSPDCDSGKKPDRFRSTEPLPSGEMMTDPELPDKVFRLRERPSRVKIPDVERKRGSVTAIIS